MDRIREGGIMSPKRIPVWLARDNDEDKGTWLYFKEPVWNNKAQKYYPAEKSKFVDFTETPQHYGIKPGECKPVYLMIGEEEE